VTRSFYAATLMIFVLVFSAAPVYSQDYGDRPSKAPEETPPGRRPGGPMAGMMPQGMGMMRREGMPTNRRAGLMMRRNPRLAGIMMQMRGEMMRIRGEAMMKQGDVLRRYGERLEKEIPTKQPAEPRGR